MSVPCDVCGGGVIGCWNCAAIRREGTEFICKVPDALGRVTRLVIRGNKVSAQTESGIEMIVPKRAIVDETKWKVTP